MQKYNLFHNINKNFNFFQPADHLFLIYLLEILAQVQGAFNPCLRQAGVFIRLIRVIRVPLRQIENVFQEKCRFLPVHVIKILQE